MRDHVGAPNGGEKLSRNNGRLCLPCRSCKSNILYVLNVTEFHVIQGVGRVASNRTSTSCSTRGRDRSGRVSRGQLEPYRYSGVRVTQLQTLLR